MGLNRIHSSKVNKIYLSILIILNSHPIILQHSPFDDYLYNNCHVKNLVWQKFDGMKIPNKGGKRIQ